MDSPGPESCPSALPENEFSFIEVDEQANKQDIKQYHSISKQSMQWHNSQLLISLSNFPKIYFTNKTMSVIETESKVTIKVITKML